MERSLLFVFSLILFALGLIMIFSTTSAEVLDHEWDKDRHHALVKQICYGLTGLCLALLVWKAGYQPLIQYAPHLLALFSVLLVLALIPGIGREVNGSRRWISLAGFSFQPSEFVKILLPAYFIHYASGLHEWRFFLKKAALAAVPIFLILIEPNNGTAAVIVLSLLVLFFLMHIPFRFWAVPVAICTVVGGLSASQLPYVASRLKVYMHPELDLRGKGHQPYQAKIALGSGGMTGRGPGNSLQKLSYLPEAQNDYIAAIYGEEFGFLGILALIGLYMGIVHAGFSLARQAEEESGYYLGGVLLFLISFQAFLNLGVVSGLVPSTGLNLPLFSQGGTSLMANIFAIGLLLNLNPRVKNHYECRTIVT